MGLSRRYEGLFCMLGMNRVYVGDGAGASRDTGLSHLRSGSPTDKCRSAGGCVDRKRARPPRYPMYRVMTKTGIPNASRVMARHVYSSELG